MKQRANLWTADEDMVVVRDVIRVLGQNKTLKQAFYESACTIGRTPSAIAWRFYTHLNKMPEVRSMVEKAKREKIWRIIEIYERGNVIDKKKPDQGGRTSSV